MQKNAQKVLFLGCVKQTRKNEGVILPGIKVKKVAWNKGLRDQHTHTKKLEGDNK